VVHAALLVAVLAAPSGAVAAAAPSFETSVLDTRATISAARTAGAKTLEGSLTARLNRLALTSRQLQSDAARLRRDAGGLRARLDRRPKDGKSETDPALRPDILRLSNEFRQSARDFQWALNDARDVHSAVKEKDPALCDAATYFYNETLWLANETRWLDMDARNLGWNLRSAGYALEAWDIENSVRDILSRSTDLRNEAELIVAAVR